MSDSKHREIYKNTTYVHCRNELSYRPANLCSMAGRYDDPIPTRS